MIILIIGINIIGGNNFSCGDKIILLYYKLDTLNINDILLDTFLVK